MAPAGGNHVLERGKLLVHLGPAATLNQAVSGAPGDLAACGGGSAGLLLGGGSRGGILLVGLLVSLGLDLDDLAGARGRRRQAELGLSLGASCLWL